MMNRDEFRDMLVDYANYCSLADSEPSDGVRMQNSYMAQKEEDVIMAMFDALQAENAAYREVLEQCADGDNWDYGYEWCGDRPALIMADEVLTKFAKGETNG